MFSCLRVVENGQTFLGNRKITVNAVRGGIVATGFESLLLRNGDGRAFDAGVEGDQDDRFGPVVSAVVPFVDDFDHGVTGFDVENSAFVGCDRELPPEDDGGVDDRMFVHGQTLARWDRDL
jgi:hypothetical protein